MHASMLSKKISIKTKLIGHFIWYAYYNSFRRTIIIMKSVINRKSTIVISPQFTDAIGVFNVHNMHKDNPGKKVIL